MENWFCSASRENALASGPLSETEQETVLAKIWQLLARQTSLYTMGDSSSVPVETAQELLASILFTLDEARKARGGPQRLLLTVPADVLLAEGRRRIEAESASARALWQTACLGIPGIESTSLRGTLRGIGRFWERYDARYFAHQIPCAIDYPLSQPVPENTPGIAYLHAYLRRLVAENRILARFNAAAAVRLLGVGAPGYAQLPLNLCEPVTDCAVGLALLGREPSGLSLTGDDRARLAALFEPLPEARARAALKGAAEQLCAGAGFRDPFTRAYVADAAQALYPRIQAALAAGDLRGIFPSAL